MASKKIVAKPTKSVAKPVAKKIISKKSEGLDVRETVQKLWLAGVGAASVAQKNVGDVVENLKTETQKIYKKASTLVEGTVADVRKQFEGVISQVQGSVAANLGWVEEKVSAGVGTVLGRLGVPSKADIEDLSKRVAELSKQVKAIAAAKTTSKKAA
jgi:poly(hydroxyalkanoate) granule-associated protein